MNRRVSLGGQVERTVALDDGVRRSLDEVLGVGSTIDLLVGIGIGYASEQNVSSSTEDTST